MDNNLINHPGVIIGFAVLVVVMLLLDLGFGNGRKKDISIIEVKKRPNGPFLLKLLFPVYQVDVECRFANRNVFTGFVKRIGILYPRILFYLYGFAGFQNDFLIFNKELLTSFNNIGVFFKFWCLERLAPFCRRDHMGNGNFAIVCCIAKMFFN